MDPFDISSHCALCLSVWCHSFAISVQRMLFQFRVNQGENENLTGLYYLYTEILLSSCCDQHPTLIMHTLAETRTYFAFTCFCMTERIFSYRKMTRVLVWILLLATVVGRYRYCKRCSLKALFLFSVICLFEDSQVKFIYIAPFIQCKLSVLHTHTNINTYLNTYKRKKIIPCPPTNTPTYTYQRESATESEGDRENRKMASHNWESRQVLCLLLKKTKLSLSNLFHRMGPQLRDQGLMIWGLWRVCKWQ